MKYIKIINSLNELSRKEKNIIIVKIILEKVFHINLATKEECEKIFKILNKKVFTKIDESDIIIM